MENMEIIAERILEIRDDYALTQAELGKKLNVSQDTISLWETGKSLPNTEYIIKLSKEFNISADYLLGLKNDY